MEVNTQAPVKTEERIIIFFILTWNRVTLTEIYNEKTIKKSILVIINCLSRYRGKTFCQEAIIKNNTQSRSIMRLNSHKWKGGIPNFHIRLPLSITERPISLHGVLIKRIVITKKITDANDWIKKYFILNILGDLFFLVKPIMGTKSSKLSSINPQTIKGLLKDNPTIVVIINSRVKLVFPNQAMR